MKLTPALVERTLGQFEAQALPENHPVVPQLSKLFGDHTFFLDAEGLHIIEPSGASESGVPTGQVVKLASWQDANRTGLAPHKPEPTGLIVALDTAA
jgi:hypothetical protein